MPLGIHFLWQHLVLGINIHALAILILTHRHHFRSPLLTSPLQRTSTTLTLQTKGDSLRTLDIKALKAALPKRRKALETTSKRACILLHPFELDKRQKQGKVTHLQPYNALDLLHVQGVKDRELVNAVDELRPEV